jgi:hypothetical protein
MAIESGSAYYLARQAQLFERFEQDAQDWRQVLSGACDCDLVESVIQQAREEFGTLIPQIPFIGGDENHLTGELIRSARCLALYKAMQAHGLTAADTGKMLYDAAEVLAARVGPTILPSERPGLEDLIRRRREQAEWSQERRYASDWVFEVVEGDGVSFDYGYDYAECAALKFYRAQGADEFMMLLANPPFPHARRREGEPAVFFPSLSVGEGLRMGVNRFANNTIHAILLFSRFPTQQDHRQGTQQKHDPGRKAPAVQPSLQSGQAAGVCLAATILDTGRVTPAPGSPAQPALRSVLWLGGGIRLAHQPKEQDQPKSTHNTRQREHGRKAHHV